MDRPNKPIVCEICNRGDQLFLMISHQKTSDTVTTVLVQCSLCKSLICADLPIHNIIAREVDISEEVI